MAVCPVFSPPLPSPLSVFTSPNAAFTALASVKRDLLLLLVLSVSGCLCTCMCVYTFLCSRGLLFLSWCWCCCCSSSRSSSLCVVRQCLSPSTSLHQQLSTLGQADTRLLSTTLFCRCCVPCSPSNATPAASARHHRNPVIESGEQTLVATHHERHLTNNGEKKERSGAQNSRTVSKFCSATPSASLFVYSCVRVGLRVRAERLSLKAHFSLLPNSRIFVLSFVLWCLTHPLPPPASFFC